MTKSSEEQLSSRRCEATCAGNPATDELSLALARQREEETDWRAAYMRVQAQAPIVATQLSAAIARQRELETERDEAERGWNSCKTTADRRRDEIGYLCKRLGASERANEAAETSAIAWQRRSEQFEDGERRALARNDDLFVQATAAETRQRELEEALRRIDLLDMWGSLGDIARAALLSPPTTKAPDHEH